MDLGVESFDRICRACLCESTDMKSLFTKLESKDLTLLDLFNSAVNMSVKTEDALPKQVCGDCERVIYQTEEFKHRCLQSETVLKGVIQGTISEPLFETNNDGEGKELKDKSFLDKLSDFDLQVVDKKELVELTQTFGSEVCYNKIGSMLPVKKEMEYDSFADDFDAEPIEPMELKHEADLIQPHTKLNFSKYKKLEFKKKKLQKKDKLSGLTVNLFSCINCNINFENMTDCQTHYATHHKVNQIPAKSDTDERLQCSLCFRRCKTKKTLSKHMKLHEQTDNIKYPCKKCKREFKYKSFLESHIISVHMHNDFSCNICTEKFNDKTSLEAHLDSHKEKKKHICRVCSKAFIMLCTLKDHMRKHTGEKPFLCSTCGKGFSQKTNLAQHQRRHLGLKPFKCNICSKSFVSKGELDAHTRKHSGAHPFVCDDCGNGFTTSSALVKHRRTHTGERPYACDLCPMRFAASGTLKNHRRTHTGERPFQCSHCEKAFVQRTDMISHVRCHTGERPYVCNQCGQSFRKHATMKTHLKMHGKEASVMHTVCSEQIHS